MTKQVLIVSHFHWDREWYRSFQEFRGRLVDAVDAVLDLATADPEFRFVLDGQAIVLEDYVEVRPENEGRLRALLDAGRLEVGPSYVLPDEILVGGEPLVRNLLLGRRVCRRFGVEPSGAGYLPDSFGHPAQMPQVLAGFGIGTCLFSRGMGDQLDDIKEPEYHCFMVMSPEESDGLPLRCYVKRGTKHERAMRNAKWVTTGKPEESYVIKGVARQNRQMVVEVIERAD